MEEQAATETTFTGGASGFASAEVLDEARELLSNESKIAVPTVVMVGSKRYLPPSDGAAESTSGSGSFQ